VAATVGQTKRPVPENGPIASASQVVEASKGISLVNGLSKQVLVELRGLEPLTPCMPCRCATSCATAPRPCGPALRRASAIVPNPAVLSLIGALVVCVDAPLTIGDALYLHPVSV